MGQGGGGRAALIGLAVASALLYALVTFKLRFSNAGQDVAGFLVAFAALFVLYGAAAFLVRRLGDGASTLGIVIGSAVLFRALLLFAGLPAERPMTALVWDLSGEATGYEPFLIYDNDVWRYLWEGHLGAAGVSPFELPPARVAELAAAGKEPLEALVADELWWDVLDNLSFHDHTSVYPPPAQWLFRLSHGLAPGSVFVWKLLVVVADLGICWVLVLLLTAVGRPRSEVLLWAWNPLVVKELAGSGHLDAWMIWPLTLAVYWLATKAEVRALAAFALSALVKIGSAPLAPLFLWRTRARTWPTLAAVAALGLLPYAGELRAFWNGLAVYGGDWIFNSGPWALVRGLAEMAGAANPSLWAHLVTKGAIAVAMVALPWRSSGSPREVVRVAFLVVALTVLLNPAVMPWYLLWALPLAVAAGNRSWAVLTGLSLLSYLFYIDGAEPAGRLWLEYGLFAIVVALEIAYRRPVRDGTPDGKGAR